MLSEKKSYQNHRSFEVSRPGPLASAIRSLLLQLCAEDTLYIHTTSCYLASSCSSLFMLYIGSDRVFVDKNKDFMIRAFKRITTDDVLSTVLPQKSLTLTHNRTKLKITFKT